MKERTWLGILLSFAAPCRGKMAASVVLAILSVAGYALSTMLAHVSAYTILEGLRLQAADRLMGAPLGEVESRSIGAMKSTIVDRIEDIEPPLAT